MAAPKILTHDFILCFFAQFTFTSVFHLLIPTLPIYLSKMGSTEVEIGILIGALGVSSLVLRPFVGKALLRISERNFMVAGTLLSMTNYQTMFLCLALTGLLNFYYFYFFVRKKKGG
jgi:MFS family permease